MDSDPLKKFERGPISPVTGPFPDEDSARAALFSIVSAAKRSSLDEAELRAVQAGAIAIHGTSLVLMHAVTFDNWYVVMI